MLDDKQLALYFGMSRLPIKDGDTWWDGIPSYFSNLKQWHLAFTQRFGQRPEYYKKYGLKGHSGIDIGFLDSCPIVAPCKLWVTYLQLDEDKGYGNHIYAETESQHINGDYYKLELVFGHFKSLEAKAGHWVEEGGSLGLGDSTGDSTGPHLHLGIRPWWSKNGNDWQQMYKDNGYAGYVDPEPYFPHIIWDLDEILHPHGWIGTYKPRDYKWVGNHWEQKK